MHSAQGWHIVTHECLSSKINILVENLCPDILPTPMGLGQKSGKEHSSRGDKLDKSPMAEGAWQSLRIQVCACPAPSALKKKSKVPAPTSRPCRAYPTDVPSLSNPIPPRILPPSSQHQIQPQTHLEDPLSGRERDLVCGAASQAPCQTNCICMCTRTQAHSATTGTTIL